MKASGGTRRHAAPDRISLDLHRTAADRAGVGLGSPRLPRGPGAAVAVAALTGFVLGRTTLAWHLAAGEVVVAALGWRIVWGLLGSTYARFSSFVPGPGRVLVHLEDLRRGRPHRHLGHNPLGAVMVFALLTVLAAIGVTGLVALGGLLKQGPLRSVLLYATGRQALQMHNLLAILLMVMIAAHAAGVAFESWRGRENLVAAMLTGHKPRDPPADAERPVRSRPAAALAITLALFAAAGVATVALAALPGRLVPPAGLDPVFAEQCGACHLAFPPSLAPAATWAAILGDLQHHFGADASLSADQAAQIRAYLTAQSADHWDTLPSHLLRVPAPDGSRRITDTPGWRRRHRHIPDAIFAASPVDGRSDCAACHADAATGAFRPQEIAIPRQARP